jgi:hypothetical protein
MKRVRPHDQVEFGMSGSGKMPAFQGDQSRYLPPTNMKARVETANRKTDRVFLVGVELKSHPAWEVSDSLEELAQLSVTAGADVLGQATQKLETPNAGTFIGSGKAVELAGQCRELSVDTVVFDDELSPAQSRNLEKIFDCKILDRTSLILDIFAQRARTREGKLQIELAQLQHLLPRLTRYWTHLSRQKGGIGMRGGEGESQLEVDRRKVGERIDRIQRDLEIVRRQRATQRAGRQRNQWPLASLVGYTNAGKSTLLNQLTGAAVVAEDRLFATLDPTTQFTNERAADVAVQALRKLVQVKADPSFRLDQSAAIVHTTSGSTYETQIAHATGTVGNPMSDQTLREKFLGNATPVIGASRASQLVEMTAKLEALNDIGDLVRACA